MSTFVLIHGGGDGGWAWHLVEAALRARGHDVVAPDLPADDESKTLVDYADAVVEAVGERRNLIVVGHSFGAFTAPLVADRLPVDALVLLAGMIPSPGEPPDRWWADTGWQSAVEEQAERDGGLTGNADPYVSFLHDVPRKLAEEATARERAHPSTAATSAPWPLEAWPNVPTRFVLCTDDRFFPPEFFRRLVSDRLGIVPDEIGGGHCVALSRPEELADMLVGYAAASGREDRVSPHEGDPPSAEAWRRPARNAAEREVRHADRMAEELRLLGTRFRAATEVGRRDRVLDIGCGTGESTRDAGRAAVDGSVLGVDVSASVLERARELTERAGLRNVSYLRADAQLHRFPPEHFDLCVSRFGTMFFTDPQAAFTNIGHALRPGARLVLMVWQSGDRNEWYTMVRDAVGADTPGAPFAVGEDPFALADPDATTAVLTSAGFEDVGVTEVCEPVYYGPDAAAAYDFVTGMRHTGELLAAADARTAERSRRRLRDVLAERDTGNGVYIGSRTWIVTGHRGDGRPFHR